MTIIPKIQCPYCHKTSRLTKFMAKSNILDGKNSGYCPHCNKLCHVDISCTLSASILPNEEYLELLQSGLRAWEAVKATGKADTKLVDTQIKSYKDCLKKWSQLEKEKH